jgi:hypothetical protein
MHPTTYPHINDVLAVLLARMQTIFNERLVGLYLYGSLVTGDFDNGVSDIDLLAATSDDINEKQFDALNEMQSDMVLRYPQWNNRLEIAYMSLNALKTFKTQTSNIAIISPGEPFHFKEAGKDWLLNWYIVREKGFTLFGPPPQKIIEPISKAEYLQAVKAQVSDWRDWINQIPHSRSWQAYAILTMCRALYTAKNGEQASKTQAAVWAEHELPEWFDLIKSALLWRQAWREKVVDPEATFPETQRFVKLIIDRVLG